MTSSANDEWNASALLDGITVLEAERLHLIALFGNTTSEMVRNIEHTIAFIKWNMHESEITKSNGD